MIVRVVGAVAGVAVAAAGVALFSAWFDPASKGQLAILGAGVAAASIVALRFLPRSTHPWVVGAGAVVVPLSAVVRPPEARFARIDEVTGRYGTVGMGDSAMDVVAVFGHSEGGEGASPTGASSFHGPTFASAPPGAGAPRDLAYADVSFALWRDSVEQLDVVGEGVRTSRGVGIGDRLAQVRRAYPGLRCGRANEGSEYERYAFCFGRLESGLWIWFGGDPVDWISLSRTRLEG